MTVGVADATPAAAASCLDEVILPAGSRKARDFLGHLPGCALQPDLPPLLAWIALGNTRAKQQEGLHFPLQVLPKEL